MDLMWWNFWSFWGWMEFETVWPEHKRDIYWFWREWIFYTAHPILINGHPRTLNIGTGWDVSWQKTRHYIFRIVCESFAHKNSKLIEKTDIYDSYPPLPFFGLAHSIFYDDFKSKYLYYPLLKDEMNLPF